MRIPLLSVVLLGSVITLTVKLFAVNNCYKSKVSVGCETAFSDDCDTCTTAGTSIGCPTQSIDYIKCEAGNSNESPNINGGRIAGPGEPGFTGGLGVSDGCGQKYLRQVACVWEWTGTSSGICRCATPSEVPTDNWAEVENEQHQLVKCSQTTTAPCTGTGGSLVASN